MDNIQQNWQQTDIDITTSSSYRDFIVSGRQKTALQNLAARYRRFSVIGGIVILIGVSYCFNDNIFPGDPLFRIIFGAAFALFGMVASLIDQWLYLGIRSIDVNTMSVKQVIDKALLYRKRHLQTVAVLFPSALALISFMVWKMHNLFFLSGAVAGFIVGLAIGLRQLLNFLADYRAITRDEE